MPAAVAEGSIHRGGDDINDDAAEDDEEKPQHETLADMTSAQLVVARTMKRLLWKVSAQAVAAAHVRNLYRNCFTSTAPFSITATCIELCLLLVTSDTDISPQT